MKANPILAVAAVAVSAAACSTPTTLSNVWRDPNYSAAPMQKMFVIGRTNDETNRRTLEDSYVSALAGHGVHAMASYHVFPDSRPDREAVRQHLESQGYDGALITTFKGVHTTTSYEPSMGFYGYYGTVWDNGYVVTDQVVKVETTLWSMHTGKLVWSASSDTDNPSSSSDAISSVVQKVVSTLTDERLIPAQGPAVAYSSPAIHAY
jgi:hypothetical protein